MDVGRYRSGQTGLTVNQVAYAFGGSSPSRPTNYDKLRARRPRAQLVVIGGALSKKSEPIFAQTGAAAENLQAGAAAAPAGRSLSEGWPPHKPAGHRSKTAKEPAKRIGTNESFRQRRAFLNYAKTFRIISIC